MDSDSEKANHGDEELQLFTSAFTTVVAAMQQLSASSRLRLFRTLATFFDFPISERHTQGIPHENSGGSRGASATSTASSVASFSEDRAITPKQFMFEKKPTTDVERMACLAYYLTHYRNTPHFKTLDLSKLNTEAAQLKFSNAASAVDNATQAGLLVPAGKGNKQLSAVGEIYVQCLPDRIAAKEAIAHARPKRKSSGGSKGPKQSTVPEDQ